MLHLPGKLKHQFFCDYKGWVGLSSLSVIITLSSGTLATWMYLAPSTVSLIAAICYPRSWRPETSV